MIKANKQQHLPASSVTRLVRQTNTESFTLTGAMNKWHEYTQTQSQHSSRNMSAFPHAHPPRILRLTHLFLASPPESEQTATPILDPTLDCFGSPGVQEVDTDALDGVFLREIHLFSLHTCCRSRCHRERPEHLAGENLPHDDGLISLLEVARHDVCLTRRKFNHLSCGWPTS